VLGLTVAAIAAVVIAWLMNITNLIPEEANLVSKPLVEERVRPGWWSLAAAFAAGIAGVEALWQKKTDTLVGTVAALALVPAGAAAGIAVLSGGMDRMLGGLLLLGMNIGLIVAMGIFTLLARAGAVAGRRASLAAGLVIVAVVVFLLAWARSSGKVPENPPELRSSSAGEVFARPLLDAPCLGPSGDRELGYADAFQSASDSRFATARSTSMRAASASTATRSSRPTRRRTGASG